MKQRQAKTHRKTKETDISAEISLDGKGTRSGGTGIGFFDHMLTLMSAHGQMSLKIAARGDLDVDSHHTVEDVGICIGQALKKALGDMRGINRYGQASIPMDEALAQVTVDISNRPFLYFDVPIKDEKVGTFDTALAKEFLRALALHGGLTLHVKVEHGDNTHHIIEAVFKALGRALGQAVSPEPRSKGPLSSKGSL